MMALSCNQAGLLAWMLLLLSLSEVQTQCPTPVLPPHSSLREGDPADTYPIGTALRLTCIPGYEYVSGRIPKITCLDTSKWSALPTLCQGKRCPVPNLENGRIETSVDLRLGEEITFACDYGFRIIGGSTRRCVLKSGTVDWNRDVPFCERIPCARPPVIPNGRYDASSSDTYDAGFTVIYRCDADYSLIGHSTITCVVAKNGVDGEWNGPSPECKKVKCHRPSIPNGKVASVYQETYTYQNKLPIECNPGYTLIGSSLTECDTDSQWKPSGPWCVKHNCTSPVPPPHSTLREDIPKEGYPVGTVLKFHCITGYEYIPGINPLITCLNTSKWSEISSLCWGKQCPPPIIENGDTDADDDNDIHLGSNVTFSCIHGYRIVGEATLKCILKDGKVDWNRAFPFCEHIPCSRPDNIPNGQFDPDPRDEYYIGSVVIYRCNRDFSLIGNSTLTCITTEDGRNGKWDLPAPECKNIKCDQPKVENGKLLCLPKPFYTYNEAISFECNSGYSAVGSLHIKCGANSSWVPAVPKCVKEVKCHRPSIPNGKVTSVFQATYTYQNKIEIECNPGYNLIGSSLIECDADSQWKPCVPRCDKDKSLEDRLDIIEKKLDLILHILQLTGYRKTICE